MRWLAIEHAVIEGPPGCGLLLCEVEETQDQHKLHGGAHVLECAQIMRRDDATAML